MRRLPAGIGTSWAVAEGSSRKWFQTYRISSGAGVARSGISSGHGAASSGNSGHCGPVAKWGSFVSYSATSCLMNAAADWCCRAG